MPAPRWCASPSTSRKRRPPCRRSANSSTAWKWTCRWSATSTTTATSCCAIFPSARKALSKYRINPGNVGQGAKRDTQFAQMIEVAIQVRQAGAHRRQLGQPRPEPAGAHHGRERGTREPVQRAGRDVRSPDHLGHRERRARRRNRPGARQDHPVVQGLGGAGPDRGLPRTGAPLRLPAAPGPDRSRHGQQGHRRLDRGACRCCCRKASATPSAFR